MNSPHQTMAQRRDDGANADASDLMLSAFFRSEMPGTFAAPALPAPPMRRFAWGSVFRSRMTLAASIAVLLAGSWFLATYFQGVEAPTAVSPGGHFIGKRDKPRDSKTDKETKPKDQPAPSR